MSFNIQGPIVWVQGSSFSGGNVATPINLVDGSSFTILETGDFYTYDTTSLAYGVIYQGGLQVGIDDVYAELSTNGLRFADGTLQTTAATGGGGGGLPLSGGTMTGNIVFGTAGQYIGAGTFDTGKGGSNGLSLVCAVGYEFNWQAGWLRTTEQNSPTPRPLYLDSVAGTTLRSWDYGNNTGIDISHYGITFPDNTTQSTAPVPSLALTGGTMTGEIGFNTSGYGYNAIRQENTAIGAAGAYAISLVAQNYDKFTWVDGYVKISSATNALQLDADSGGMLSLVSFNNGYGTKVSWDGITFPDNTTQTTAAVGGFSDAPADGTSYTRNNNAWTQAITFQDNSVQYTSATNLGFIDGTALSTALGSYLPLSGGTLVGYSTIYGYNTYFELSGVDSRILFTNFPYGSQISYYGFSVGDGVFDTSVTQIGVSFSDGSVQTTAAVAGLPLAGGSMDADAVITVPTTGYYTSVAPTVLKVFESTNELGVTIAHDSIAIQHIDTPNVTAYFTNEYIGFEDVSGTPHSTYIEHDVITVQDDNYTTQMRSTGVSLSTGGSITFGDSTIQTTAGIPEAPIDGNHYVRKDGVWIQCTTVSIYDSNTSTSYTCLTI